MTFRDSQDPVNKNTQPKVQSGRTWTASSAVEEAESRLKHKEMVGATQTGHQGFGRTTHKWWSSSTDKERRGLVTQEIREAEEENRLATAVGQSKQGAWTRWESVEQHCMTWNVLWQMEHLHISFLYRSTYNLLPTPANLSVWYEDKTDCCSACGKKGTLQHVSPLPRGRVLSPSTCILTLLKHNITRHFNPNSPTLVASIPLLKKCAAGGEAWRSDLSSAGGENPNFRHINQ